MPLSSADERSIGNQSDTSIERSDDNRTPSAVEIRTRHCIAEPMKIESRPVFLHTPVASVCVGRFVAPLGPGLHVSDRFIHGMDSYANSYCLPPGSERAVQYDVFPTERKVASFLQWIEFFSLCPLVPKR